MHSFKQLMYYFYEFRGKEHDVLRRPWQITVQPLADNTQLI